MFLAYCDYIAKVTKDALSNDIINRYTFIKEVGRVK